MAECAQNVPAGCTLVAWAGCGQSRVVTTMIMYQESIQEGLVSHKRRGSPTFGDERVLSPHVRCRAESSGYTSGDFED